MSKSPNTLGNYPHVGDTTSEGGYGGQAFAPVAQRGLIDQTTDGQPLGDKLQDAKQGVDETSHKRYKADQQHQGQGLNPYESETFENRDEAAARLSSSITDSRARQYENMSNSAAST
ncbi:hypothetical protein EW145_g2134 [Phellinidium pouzarii]|uniref:Uncharacterized protein n=1 Tax=Phellinidium pouzarii TaxID=167371 RepID=A0A4S4LCJ5_9AGAM|nr:hypothetical protein EW145_g2134 [Phellinidium pouzarii]